MKGWTRISHITLFILLAAGTALAAPPGGGGSPSVVVINGTQGNWQMLVDGSPYTIQGLDFGPDVAAADAYMADVAAMGANTVRTWGTGAQTGTLLDAAAAHGVKVMMGHWLQQHIDYADDGPYKSRSIREITRRVKDYRDHPAVLCWNVGNEVILFLSDYFSGQELEDNRVAYAQFVGTLADEIHAVDPNHPVTTTVAWTGAWDYLEAHAQSLDFYSVNAYGGIAWVSDGWDAGSYTKPYSVTEYGPLGEWEVDDDTNGVPTEPADLEKRDGYTFAWSEITGHTGVALGGFAFIYGEMEDFGGIWFNSHHLGLRRLAYYAMKDNYAGVVPGDNRPPEITAMTLNPASNAPAGSVVTVSVSVTDPEGDPLTYTLKQNSKYINGSEGIANANFVDVGNGVFSLTAPSTVGVWKIYVYAYDGQGNIGIETRSLGVVP